MGIDKRKNAILKELIDNMNNSIYEQEGTIESIIEDAFKVNDAYIDDEGNYTFDVYELKSFVTNILGQCENFIESFIKESE
jgi:hypothetical protein